MLDSAFCPRSTSQWTMFTGLISGRLTQSLSLSVRIALLMLLVLLIIGAAAALRKPSRQQRIRLWCRRFRWNRRRTHIVVALTVACLLVTSPPGLALVTQALTIQIPSDSGVKADAIVVLGRGPRLMYDRINATVALWQSHRAPRIFVSGRGDAPEIIDQLLERGIPRNAVDGENCSLTTEENAQFTADLIMPQGVKRIILVTDSPHMLRSRLTFQSLGFEVVSYPNDLPSNLGYRKQMELVVREYGGMLTYLLRGRFHEREATLIEQRYGLMEFK